MANALTSLTHTLLAEKALQAFTAAVAPITSFANDFSSDVVEKGDKVKVLTVSAADAAKDFEGTYTVQDADAEGKDVTIDKRKYTSWGLTTENLRNMPQLSLDRFAEQKGFQLAKAVLQDVLSLVTNANFGAAAFTGAATSFDADDVADIENVCDVADWPESMRSLLLSPAYHNAVVKDNQVQGTIGLSASEVLRNSRINQLHNFDVIKSNLIPGNSENLVGLAAHPDAIACAMRALQPEDTSNLISFEIITNEAGMVLVFKEWYDPDTDTTKRVLEANYGYLLTNAAAIERIVSA